MNYRSLRETTVDLLNSVHRLPDTGEVKKLCYEVVRQSSRILFKHIHGDKYLITASTWAMDWTKVELAWEHGYSSKYFVVIEHACFKDTFTDYVAVDGSFVVAFRDPEDAVWFKLAFDIDV